MKASVLAIGTELTTGQITNKNAAWLSEKLKPFGVQVLLHVTIPDDRELILNSLKYLALTTDIIFITGGLGPTSDDFTRDLVGTWSEQKMIFDEKSWSDIQTRLSERGFPVRDIQRQQCYFPENSKILKNFQGTANGFYLEKMTNGKTTKVFVLPGPPREIAAIWKDHIDSWLQANTGHLDKLVTKSWDTIGVGESDVALRVEQVLTSLPAETKIDIGYRVHLPYVEVKLTYSESASEKLQTMVSAVDKTLSNITLTKDSVDIAEMAVQKLQQTDFAFYDFVSKGFLHTRLEKYLKQIPNWSWKQSDSEVNVDLFANEENFLALLPMNENESLILFEFNGKRHQKIVKAPMQSALMQERRRQYFAELALAYFCKLDF